MMENATKRTYQKQIVSAFATELSECADEQTLLHKVIAYYHNTLLENPEALAYLDKYGLHDLELITHFQLGFANHSLLGELPPTRRKGGKVRTQLQHLGIIRDSGHEHFQATVVVPFFDDKNNIVQLYGRKIKDNLPQGRQYHVYWQDQQVVFNQQGLISSSEIIICQRIFDALLVWKHGFKNVTACDESYTLTEETIQWFKQHQIQRIFIAYDSDVEGIHAAHELIARLATYGIQGLRIIFPEDIDVGEFSRKSSHPQKALAGLINHARAGQTDVVVPLPHHTAEKIPAVINNETAVISTTSSLPVLTQHEGDLQMVFVERQYRIRGVAIHGKTDQLKVTLRVNQGDLFHVDVFDLYSAKARNSFIRSTAAELLCLEETLKTEVGKVLRGIEHYQDEQRHQIIDDMPSITLTPEEEAHALTLLRAPDLLERILNDFNQCGVIGEESNKLVGYIACVSRKLDKPLAVLIQSTSAAGKSSLMESILAMIPPEEKIQYSAMTGQSLFYLGKTDLQHKILSIAEEEGATHASYALKLLQSEGQVTIASTGKDDTTGDLVTKQYTVEGPIALFLTTTAIDIDEELLNRCIVLSVNETREQTRAIHAQQRARRTLAGLQTQLNRQATLTLHHNVQRLLKPLAVINPYAEHLTFLDCKTRTRRDHEKYLTLIDAITLLHQYQREIKTFLHDGNRVEYIEVTLADIEHANRLAHDVLGRTLDELPPQTRNLLKLIQAMVDEQCVQQNITQRQLRFSRKQIRDYSGWGNTQLKIHCRRLEELDYLLVHRGKHRLFEYELLLDTNADHQESHLMGLIDHQKLPLELAKSGVNDQWSGQSRPKVGGVSGHGRDAENDKTPDKNAANSQITSNSTKNARPTSKKMDTQVQISAEVNNNDAT